MKAKQNQLTYMHFTVFDTDGTTPLTGQSGSCTSSLRKNGATTAESVSIAEIGSTGYYYASFTPLAIAQYDLEVTCPDDRVVGETYEVEAVDLDDLKTEIDANETKIDVIDGIVDSILADTGTSLPATLSTVEGKIDVIDGIVDDILVDSNEIQGKLPANDIADQSLIDADLTTIEGKIDVIDANVDILVVDTSRIKGMIYGNLVIEYDYTGSDNDVCRIYIYDTKANAQAHVKGSGLQTGGLYEYSYDASGRFTDHRPDMAKYYEES